MVAAKKWTDSAIGVVSHAYFLLGEMDKEQQIPDWKRYFRKGISILKKKKNGPSGLEAYRIGSVYKMMEEWSNARRWFTKPELKNCSPDMKAGTFFHLGEISLQLDERRQAREYFTRCLKFNPRHGKASEHMKNLVEEA